MKRLSLLLALLLVLTILLPTCRSDKESYPPSPAEDREDIEVASSEAEDPPALPLPEPAPMALEEMLTIARDNHHYLVRSWGSDPEDLLAMVDIGLSPEEDAATAALVAGLLSGDNTPPKPETVSVGAAVEDLELLAVYLKYGYAGYGLFGGEEIDTALAQLSDSLLDATFGDVDVALSTDALAASLRDILYPLLPDRHFSVDYWRWDSHFPYTAREPRFVRGESRTWYAMMEDGLRKINGLNKESDSAGVEPEGGLRPMLDQNGEIYYRMAVTADEAPVVEYVFADGGKEPVALEAVELDYSRREGLWSLEERDGIPVLTISSFMPMSDEDYAHMEELAATADELRGEPHLIIDLRGNTGGMAYYGENWLCRFLELEEGSFSALGLSATMLTETALATYPEYYGDWYPQWCEEERAAGNLPGWQVDGGGALEKHFQNDTVIFVLVDATSRSAAEYMALYLTAVDNVVLVGTSTAGQFNFGCNRAIRLPNSGVQIACGFNIFVTPDLELVDGRGIHPDLWCDGNPLEAVAALVHGGSAP